VPFASEPERRTLEAFAALADGNPFLPERVAAEERALGERFVAGDAVWHPDAQLDGLNPNLDGLSGASETLAARLRERLADGARARQEELLHYEALVRYVLFTRYQNDFYELILAARGGRASTRKLPFWTRFRRDFAELLEIPGVRLPHPVSAAHHFAWGFQIRRAFDYTFRQISGGSMPAARLRADVWQSIFTVDPARYHRALTGRMADIPTLVTGESGTGKELVARALAYSQYVPFDEEGQRFAEEFQDAFVAVNLSALSPTLVESELFGHRKGAFTGAVEDRTGWLESCGPHGTVFLDEIGDLDGAIQVKLLRLLQERTFQRIGETRERRFLGKIVAATNRDLPAEMRAGRFRPDLFYRLCADPIRTPTLAEQLAAGAHERSNLLLVLARRIAGPDEAPALARECDRWIDRHLDGGYPWPGNIRELEQCVRSVLVRGRYEPPTGAPAGGSLGDDLADDLAEGRLSADALLRRYCTEVYARTGSYEETARRLELDRRTVKSRIDRDLLARLQADT